LAAVERRLHARYGLQVTQRHVDLIEPPIRVRVLEVGEGPPLLLLHGVTLLADHWAPLLAELAGFRCIAVDLPGHGRSDPVDFRRLPLRRWYVGMWSGTPWAGCWACGWRWTPPSGSRRWW
jgi:pimeloyl-ACP methyl ester carboxylesterase